MTDGSCPAELGAKIESNIRALLVGEPFLYKTQDTKQVKLRLHEMGRSSGFTVLASGFPADRTNWKAGPEWLYDMVWVAYETEPTTPPQKMVVHFLTRQAMVMECEMRQGRPSREDRDVDEDFQKLVQARADVGLDRLAWAREKAPRSISRTVRSKLKHFLTRCPAINTCLSFWLEHHWATSWWNCTPIFRRTALDQMFA